MSVRSAKLWHYMGASFRPQKWGEIPGPQKGLQKIICFNCLICNCKKCDPKDFLKIAKERGQVIWPPSEGTKGHGPYSQNPPRACGVTNAFFFSSSQSFFLLFLHLFYSAT